MKVKIKFAKNLALASMFFVCLPTSSEEKDSTAITEFEISLDDVSIEVLVYRLNLLTRPSAI